MLLNRLLFYCLLDRIFRDNILLIRYCKAKNVIDDYFLATITLIAIDFNKLFIYITLTKLILKLLLATRAAS